MGGAGGQAFYCRATEDQCVCYCEGSEASRVLCVYLLSDINDVLYVRPLSTVGPQQINANTVFYCSFGVTAGSTLIYVGNIRP